MTYHVQVWYRKGDSACYTCTDVIFYAEKPAALPASVEIYLFRHHFGNGPSISKTLSPQDVHRLLVIGRLGDPIEVVWPDPVNTAEQQQEEQDVGRPSTQDLPRPEDE